MNMRVFPLLMGCALAALLAACGGAAATQQEVLSTAVVESKPLQPTSAPEATAAGAPRPTPTQQLTEEAARESPAYAITASPKADAAPTQPLAEPTRAVAPADAKATDTPPPAAAVSAIESRLVELEYPQQMRLGDSDIIRLSIMPTQEGYTLTLEFPEHTALTRTVDVRRHPGYDLSVVARLDGVGFDLSPQGEQINALPPGEEVTWRWTLTPRAAGQQRASVSLILRWTPQAGTAGSVRESLIYSKGININVTALLGMTTAQAAANGFVGLLLGGGMGMLAVVSRRRVILPSPLRTSAPNEALVIEPSPGLDLPAEDEALTRALFRRYARLVIQSEFRSGYSGARTLLALPVRADGRADAHTIAKLGDAVSIRREYNNYEAFVKDTLPPITARIQEPPTRVRGGRRAALRYTFIGEPGHDPVSLRDALLAHADPDLLTRLFNTFGPNWWMQRRPYTFRPALEYDRVLPAHYVVEPTHSRGKPLDGADASAHLHIGDVVTLRGFPVVEPRADGRSLSLSGRAAAGQPPLRVRWLSTAPPNGASGRIVATRTSLLRDYVADFALLGLPDPLPLLAAWLNEPITGTQSIIHGDLNLENILVGPGGFVWLIDFAETREGHTLSDFAHLEAQIIAHIIAAQSPSPQEYLNNLRADAYPLLNTLHDIANLCLLNPAQPREYGIALGLACLGALKFTNLTREAKQLLYLTAANLAGEL